MPTMPLPSSQNSLSGPRPVRWTCAEFHRFGDLGVFEGRRDGAAVVQLTPTGRATVAALAMNRPLALAIRLQEAGRGRHLPDAGTRSE